MIVRPWNGKPITAPGIYSDIPMTTKDGRGYHQAITQAPSISSTGIRTIFSKSPAHYFNGSYLNPDAKPQKDTDAFRFGRAAHFLLLGEKGFRDNFVIRPEKFRDDESKLQPWNGQKPYCKQWAKEQAAAGLTVITKPELDAIHGMAVSLRKEPLIRAGILNGLIEHSMIWQDEETKVWLKVRPDAIPAVDMAISDLKTASDVTDEGIEKAISDNDLHVQGALIGMACKALLGRPMESFSLVFVEKEEPHCVRVVELSGADLDLGEQQIRAVLPIFAKACETGVWHGPGGGQQDATYFPVRPYRVKQIERRLEILKLEASL